jgi:hypothetical protein
MDDLIARLRAGTVTPADLDAAADALGDGSFYQEKDIDAMQARIRELEAQLAAPAVKVKPLVWEEWGVKHRRVFAAQTAIGYYCVTELFFPETYFQIETPNGKTLTESTADAAKAAAQADYEARILAATETIPVAEVWRRAMEAAAQSAGVGTFPIAGMYEDLSPWAGARANECARIQNAIRALPLPDDLGGKP